MHGMIQLTPAGPVCHGAGTPTSLGNIWGFHAGARGARGLVIGTIWKHGDGISDLGPQFMNRSRTKPGSCLV